MPVNTVRDCARKLKARRAGKLKSDAAMLPARDAVEALRRRLVSLADREMRVAERQKRGTVQPETLRQIARAVREIAAIPGIDDARPIHPGSTTPRDRPRQGDRPAAEWPERSSAHPMRRAFQRRTRPHLETPLQTGTLQGEDARDARVETQDADGDSGGQRARCLGAGELGCGLGLGRGGSEGLEHHVSSARGPTFGSRARGGGVWGWKPGRPRARMQGAKFEAGPPPDRTRSPRRNETH